MTKQEQIEEIVKLDIEESAGLHSAFINDMRISKNKPLSISKTIMTFNCPKKDILHAIGIPENAITLTKEEQSKILKATEKRINELKQQIEQTRKETAKGIFSELREFVKNRKHRFDLECNVAEETAKSYNEDEYGKEVFTKILHKKDGAWCECDVIESEIDNLAKEYGVEVEE